MILPYKTAIFCFKMMKDENPSSNVYQPFLSAMIHTLYPPSTCIGAIFPDLVHVNTKITRIRRYVNIELLKWFLRTGTTTGMMLRNSGIVLNRSVFSIMKYY